MGPGLNNMNNVISSGNLYACTGLQNGNLVCGTDSGAIKRWTNWLSEIAKFCRLISQKTLHLGKSKKQLNFFNTNDQIKQIGIVKFFGYKNKYIKVMKKKEKK